MKSFDYYSSANKTYINPVDYTTVYVYSQGVCLAAVPAGEFTRELYPDKVLIERSIDQNALNAARKEASQRAATLHEEFKNDLYKEFCVEDNPKREQAFQIAWEYGHSSGYEDVCNHFCNIVDLIR